MNAICQGCNIGQLAWQHMEVLNAILLSISSVNGTTIVVDCTIQLERVGICKSEKSLPSRFQQKQSRCEHGMLVKTIG